MRPGLIYFPTSLMTTSLVKHLTAALFLIPMMLLAQAPTARATQPTGQSRRMPNQTATAVHQSAIIVDTHADTTQRLLDENFDLASAPLGDIGHLDFAKARAG